MKKILFTLFGLAAMTAVQAVPAWTGWQQRKLADGGMVSCRLLGDEHCHAYVAADGLRLLEKPDGTMEYCDDKAPFDFGQFYASAARSRSPRRVLGGDFPTIGTVKGLVVLAQFADNAFQEGHTQQVFHEAMNQEGCTAYGATGSSRDYFISQSWGQFTPQFDVVGPVTLSRSMQYYGSNNTQGSDRHPGEMVREACQLIHDSLQVDFSQYDYNNDGDVDFVYVIYAGYAESYGASSNTIWPHAANLTDMGVYASFDGKRLQRYACSSELKYTTGTQLEGIGVFCHEFSHVLGLPDMYNTYQTQSVQLGAWDVMDQGNYNNESHTPPSYSAFERASLGWMTLTELETPADTMLLPELNDSRMAYRITTTGNPDEYFTLENRQQQQWDAFQPARGMMVIHVDYDAATWERNGVNSGLHPHYDLVEADGTQGREQQTDLYPTATNDMLTDYSEPNMLAWDGTPTEKGITNIRQLADGNISFSFMRDRLNSPKHLWASDIEDRAFTLHWKAVAEAIAYRIDLSEQLCDEENPVLLDEDFSLMGGDSYPKSGFTDISGQLDEYTHKKGWTGNDVYEAGGYVRLGSYGTTGILTTPAVNTAADTLTLALRCQSYPGKSVSYTVTLTGTEPAQSYSLKATKTAEDQLLRFTATSGRRVQASITTSRERLFIDHLRLFKDTIDADMAWMETETRWTVDSIRPEAIDAPSWCITGLKPQHLYTVMVTALADDANRTSAPSEAFSVNTTGNSGEDTTNIATAVDSPQWRRVCYDLQGRRMQKPGKGVYIIRDGRQVRKMVKP
jgi:M6 family metalloprotease-like protein